MIELTIPGPPQGKARAKVTRTGHAYTPGKTVLYENLVKTLYLQRYDAVMSEDRPALEVRILACFPVLKSMKKTDREAALTGRIRPAKKPDADNIAKVVLDALNGLAYHDDAQVVRLELDKLYSDAPRVEVTIKKYSGGCMTAYAANPPRQDA